VPRFPAFAQPLIPALKLFNIQPPRTYNKKQIIEAFKKNMKGFKKKMLIALICLFVCLKQFQAFCDPSNIDEALNTPFEKVVILKTKVETITAQNIKAVDQYIEIVDQKGKLILCKTNEIEEIACLFPEEIDNQKSEDIKKALEVFPKAESKLSKDPRFTAEIIKKWELLLQNTLKNETQKQQDAQLYREKSEQNKIQAEGTRRLEEIELLRNKLPERLGQFISRWKGHSDYISFYNPDTDPEAAKKDHEESVRLYLRIPNRTSGPGKTIAGGIAFKILGYLKTRYPEKWPEMIVDNNTPWKNSISMEEVLENFYSNDVLNEEVDANRQKDLEERKRRATEF